MSAVVTWEPLSPRFVGTIGTRNPSLPIEPASWGMTGNASAPGYPRRWQGRL